MLPYFHWSQLSINYAYCLIWGKTGRNLSIENKTISPSRQANVLVAGFFPERD
jgi:hypothetical protein